MDLCFAGARTMLLLKVFQHASGQSSKGLQSSPAELLLLTQGGIFTDEPVVLPVEALTVRTLAGLFWH
jgi:hypothetical protein